eukprot:9489706-Pyramimonas_sp.AAC.1
MPDPSEEQDLDQVLRRGKRLLEQLRNDHDDEVRSDRMRRHWAFKEDRAEAGKLQQREGGRLLHVQCEQVRAIHQQKTVKLLTTGKQYFEDTQKTHKVTK